MPDVGGEVDAQIGVVRPISHREPEPRRRDARDVPLEVVAIVMVAAERSLVCEAGAVRQQVTECDQRLRVLVVGAVDGEIGQVLDDWRV